VSIAGNPRLERVLTQLRLYEHPLLKFSARAKGEEGAAIERRSLMNTPRMRKSMS
jgi:NADH:ubiquinone oxidoreductase subunit C